MNLKNLQALIPPMSIQEATRLKDLYQYRILDTEPETDYTDLAELASLICECPIAAITFIDEKRQWFKAKVGDTVKQTSRDISFCSHTILQDDALVVTDTATDSRFSQNPDVTGGLKIRFYTGCPIYSAQGNKLGAVCVIDRKPRRLKDAQIRTLKLISKQVSQLLELHKRNNLLKSLSRKLLLNFEKTVESFFDNSMIPKWIYEADTLRILQVNDAAIRKYGYSRKAFMKMSVFDLRTNEEKRKIHQLLKNVSLDSTASTFETVHLTKNGTEVNVEVSVNDIVFLGKVARLATIVDITERKSTENKLRIERDVHSKRIAKAKHEAEKSIKDNIGRELHDNIQQILVGTNLFLSIARRNEELRLDMIDRCKENITEAIHVIRQLSSSLVNFEEHDFKFTDAVQKMAGSIAITDTSQVHLSIDNRAENLPNDLKINLFRIIQEQVNNILKYAQASVMNISLVISDSIQLWIKDNGVGFNPSQASKGIGLHNIKNRARFYNGTTRISSSPNKGVELLVQLPLVQEVKMAL